MVRDITFDGRSQAHADHVVERIAALPGFRVRSASDRVFLMHLGGKISTKQQGARQDAQHPVDDLHARRRPRLPGHRRRPRQRLHLHHAGQLRRRRHRRQRHPRPRQPRPRRGHAGHGGQDRAAQGVRRHRRLADLPGDAGRPTASSRRSSAIAPSFGAINLEDISAPRCFEVEAAPRASCSTSPSCTTTSTAPPSSCSPPSSTP